MNAAQDSLPRPSTQAQRAPSAIEVILADDHRLVRSGIRALLGLIPGVRVIAEASDGIELLSLLNSVHPDVVITDISMPGMDGISALIEIKARHPALKVIVLSMHDSAEVVKRAVACGAAAYLRKDANEFELGSALQTVMSTGSYLSGGVVKQLLEPSQPAAEDMLTPRQIEMLKLLAQGMSSKEIAYAIGLSSKTVDVHRAHIMGRLGMRDLASLTRYAVRSGLLKA
jgi:two-component system, NarL family, nitrate/nitrite response regulator NarL